MKKLVLALVVFVGLIFVGCTDNSLEDLESNELYKTEKEIKLRGATDPANNGHIKDTDPDDDGEG